MTKNKIPRTICCTILLILCISVASLSGIKVTFASIPDVNTPISEALDYLDSVQQSNGAISDFEISSWAVMAIAASGEDPDSWTGSSGASIVDYLITNKNQLDSVLPDNYVLAVARFMLAMTAAGEDPSDITGTDYVAILKGEIVNGQIGSEAKLNDDFWGVMALISAGESASSTEVQGSVAFIKSHQNVDGGWGWAVGGSSDVSDTTAAIMALKSAGESSSSAWIINALQYLEDNQHSNGGFSYGTDEPDSGSDSWAIGAIVSVGQHPAQWPVVGTSVLEHLLSLQNADGSFNWKSGDPGTSLTWMTSYAIIALCFNPYPVNLTPPTINLQGDFNVDDKINYQDISTFVDQYIYYWSGDPWDEDADFNNDNKVNYQDISMFVDFYIGYWS